MMDIVDIELAKLNADQQRFFIKFVNDIAQVFADEFENLPPELENSTLECVGKLADMLMEHEIMLMSDTGGELSQFINRLRVRIVREYYLATYRAACIAVRSFYAASGVLEDG